MSISANRPSEAMLQEMAIQPKMTFAKMARELGKDRKTVRSWCREAGIEKCGPSSPVENQDNQSISDLPVEKQSTPDNNAKKPISQGVIKDLSQPAPDSEIETLRNKVAWLIEWNTIIHDRMKALEESAVGFKSLLKIGYKMGAGEELTEEENDFFADFFMLTRAATAGDFAQLDRRIETHWHSSLCVADSKMYLIEKKNGGTGTPIK